MVGDLAHHPRPIGMVPVMPLLRPTIFEADRIILSRDLGDHLLEPIDREVEVEIVHLAGEEMQLPAKLRRSEEHTSELQSLMRISYAVFCLQTKTYTHTHYTST